MTRERPRKSPPRKREPARTAPAETRDTPGATRLRLAARFPDLESLLAAEQRFHVWVVVYTHKTHREMWLAIHDGGFADRVVLHATGCRAWEGPLEGGPYRLALDVLSASTDTNAPELRLFDRDGGFELRCASVAVGAIPTVQIEATP